MKIRIYTVLLGISILYACNNANPPANVVTDSAHTEAAAEHSELVTALSLNHGEKWLSDENTRNHVSKLSDIFSSFGSKSRSGISDYQTLASEVQNELNGLIKDCKMSGPDHDALHLWLEPVLNSTAKLKNVQTMEEAEAIVELLTENIRKFNIYFS